MKSIITSMSNQFIYIRVYWSEYTPYKHDEDPPFLFLQLVNLEQKHTYET